jgi:hypothetical protein
MTQLLEQALAQLRNLPASEQDAMASLILDEIADEKRWGASFAASHEALSKLADKVRSDVREGRVRDVGLDEICNRL